MYSIIEIIMSKALTSLFEYIDKGKVEKKALLGKQWFKKSLEGKTAYIKENYHDYGLDKPGRIDAYKALLQSETQAVADSVLVQTELFNTIWEGAEPQKCFRQALNIYPAQGHKVRVTVDESGTYANYAAEGANIEVDTSTFTYKDVDIKKIGVRIQVTSELLEDCAYSLMEQQVRKAGFRIENEDLFSLNRPKTVNATKRKGNTVLSRWFKILYQCRAYRLKLQELKNKISARVVDIINLMKIYAELTRWKLKCKNYRIKSL